MLFIKSPIYKNVMIFPDVKLEDWLEKYPTLRDIKDTCEINFCVHCNEQIIPDRPFIKKDYVGLYSDTCPHCGKEYHVQVSITNSNKEYQKWDHLS